jgi:2-amino-4-hydroxy-6-hydroxymethyldihydropteridine diphosphokinase
MQPNFINAVALFALDGPMPDPARLLGRLQEIETQAGRQRAAPNGPRTLDLDIVIMGELVRDAPDPVLPHPRAHLRRFVLEPLRDVWPGWRHPVSGLSIEAMLAALPEENIHRLAPDADD